MPAPAPSSPGQQLTQLFEEVWAVEDRIKLLKSSDVDHASGLQASIEEFGLTPESPRELSIVQWAAIGRKGVDSFLEAETRAEEIEKASLKKEQVRYALIDLIGGLTGSQVTVQALSAADRPIDLMRAGGVLLGQAPKHVRSLPAATGILKPYSFSSHNTSVMELAKPRKMGVIKPSGSYVVRMCSPTEAPPARRSRVSIAIS